MEHSADAQYDDDSDWSNDSYKPSHKGESPSPSEEAPSTSSYNLRDHSQLRRPERYRADEVVTRPAPPAYIHPRPLFNEEYARLVPWNTIPLDAPGPSPTEMAYQQLLAERERKKNNPSDGKDDIPFKPFQEVLDGTSKGPCVAHLSRRSLKKNPLRADGENIFDNTKFHPASDKWSFRDEYNPEYSLDGPEEDDQAELDLERRKAFYVNWTELSDGIKWAVIHDLTQDYGFTGTTRLLSLSVDEVISFRKLYASEKTKWDAYKARIAAEVKDAVKRAPNECARPFPRADPDAAPSAPALELVTMSLDRGEIAKGYRYLKFMGLDKYAANFDEWFGSGSSFFEMPEVLDLNLDFENPTYYRYPAFGPYSPDVLPQAEDSEQGIQQPPAGPPGSPGMPNLTVGWPPIIDESYNADAMDIARRAFRPSVASEEAPASQGDSYSMNSPVGHPSGGNHPMPSAKPVQFDPIIFDPIERIRAEAQEDFLRRMNPGRVIIDGNADEELGSRLEHAGYRHATAADLLPRVRDRAGFQFAPGDNDSVPHFKENALDAAANDWPAELFSEVMEDSFMQDFALDAPGSNSNELAANNAPRVPAAGASASKWAQPYTNPSPHGNVDDSDPVLDAFPPEQDDPNDDDYEELATKRQRGPAQQKPMAGKAQLGSAAMAARVPKKPRQSRKRTEPSGSTSQHPQAAEPAPGPAEKDH